MAAPARDIPSAIVLGVEHPRAVAVVRSLGRIGVPVVGVDHIRTARGMSSRYLREKIVVGPRHEDALATLSSLPGHRGAMLIATNDHYLTLVSQQFERLAERYVLTTPPWDVVETLMDKRRCYELGRSVGVQVPTFFMPTTIPELDHVIAALDFTRHDYILSKTLPVAEPTDRSSRRFTRVAGLDAATVRARCLEVLKRTGELPMIVEVVPGSSETCVGVSMVLDPRLEPVAWYCVKRLQLRPYLKDQGFVHPYELGANVYCESIHDDEAVDAARRLLQAAGHYGVATVELRRDALDGTLKLVKVDPRFVRATSLSTALGTDLPRALFRVFAGQPADVARTYAAGVSWIWPSWYLDTVRKQGLRIFARRLGSLLRDRTIGATAYLSLDDPMPAVVDVRKWGRAYAVSAWRRLREKRRAWGGRREPPPVTASGGSHERSELARLCEAAMGVGRTIDLTGCYFEVTGRDAYVSCNYYPLLAGLTAVMGMRQVLDVGTRFGGSVLAMRKAMDGGDAPGRVVVTIDIHDRATEDVLRYPDIVRVIGDATDPAVGRGVVARFQAPIDMIFIDAHHTYEATKAYIDYYAGALRPKLVVVDDIHLNPSMQALWDELVERFGPRRSCDASTLTGRGLDCGIGVIAWDNQASS